MVRTKPVIAQTVTNARQKLLGLKKYKANIMNELATTSSEPYEKIRPKKFANELVSKGSDIS